MKLFLLLLLLPSCLYAQGLTINDAAYQRVAQKRSSLEVKKLPPQVDLSVYTPTVMNQGELGTCVAVSVGYYMRTMLEARRLGITNKARVDALRFSPSFLYNHIKDATDANCKDGADINAALEYIKQNGLPSLAAQPYPNCQKSSVVAVSPTSKLLDYAKLFGILDDDDVKEWATKKALSEYSPVVVGVQTTPSIKELSFRNTVMPRAQNLIGWSKATAQAEFSLWQPARSTSLGYGHAMCVVGYDDKKFGTGAFRLVNSWGNFWGDKGFFWISYSDFRKYAKYGYQAYVQPATDRSAISLSADLTISVGTFVTGTDVPVERTRLGTRLTAYTLKEPQRTGTPYKFSVDLTKQTYLYVVAATATENITTRLFPDAGFSPVIGANTKVELPADGLFKLEGAPGLEYCLFLFSATAIDIDAYVAKINAEKGPFPDRVIAAFGSKLLPYQQANYKEKKMGFFLKSQQQGFIVPMLVSLNHVK